MDVRNKNPLTEISDSIVLESTQDRVEVINRYILYCLVSYDYCVMLNLPRLEKNWYVYAVSSMIRWPVCMLQATAITMEHRWMPSPYVIEC